VTKESLVRRRTNFAALTLPSSAQESIDLNLMCQGSLHVKLLTIVGSTSLSSCHRFHIHLVRKQCLTNSVQVV
jgi:hypothetical protein